MFVLLSLVLVFSRRARFAGTTLVSPYRWTLFCLALVGIAELAGPMSSLSENTLRAVRYAAAAATFCPIMAIMGAKRPQNTGWQLIVASLWGVLILPVVEMLVLWRGGAMDEGPAREWFMLILIFVSFSNYALTQFVMAAILAAMGQTLLLLPQLPFDLATPSWSFRAGNTAIALAILVAWFQTRTKSRHQGWDRVWLDFRNAFGLVWSLRVMERVNSTAKLGNWGTELNWFGFADDTHNRKSLDSNNDQQREQAIRTLLRRFVSEPWINQRLGGNVSKAEL